MNAGSIGQSLDAGRRCGSTMTARPSRAEKRSGVGAGAEAVIAAEAEAEVEAEMGTAGPHIGTTAPEPLTPSTTATIGGTTRRCHRLRSMAVRCCGHSRSCGLNGTTLLTVGGRRRRCWRCRFQHRCRVMAIRTLVSRRSLHPARNGCGKYRRLGERMDEVMGIGVMRE
ncbi:hypothetical protein BKA80DRAFT_283855 [Phyllosticta citrichinensis]